MLYYLLPPLANFAPVLGALNVTRYITFRTAAASLTALAISILFGPWLIRTLRDFQIDDVVIEEVFTVAGRNRLELRSRGVDQNGIELTDFRGDFDGHEVKLSGPVEAGQQKRSA